MEGSFVELFSKCQRSGPCISLDAGFDTIKVGGRRTYVDPNASRCENAMDDAKIIDDIFGLSHITTFSISTLGPRSCDSRYR